jgi:hypothetical protein
MSRSVRLCLSLVAALLIMRPAVAGGPIPVSVVQDKAGWHLERDGEPFFIKGGCIVRTTASDPDVPRLLDAVRDSGGNAIRLWATGPGTMSILDAAHERGLAVMLGLWMQHSTGHVDSVGGNFDYLDAEAVAAQMTSIAAQVELYKSHPAILAWGVGNELEHLTAEADEDQVMVAAIWQAIDAMAAKVKEIDPNHPTISVTADLGEWHLVDNATQLATYCPNIDIWGVNAYETLPQIRAKIDAGPWDRPYLVPEYGPSGWWGAAKTAWGGRIEHTSTIKANYYRNGWVNSVAGQSDRCLGGFVYLWDDLDPPTDTWFLMFGPAGEPSACVDAMVEAWTGAPPADRAPQVTGISGVGSQIFIPGDSATATLAVTDPEGDPIVVDWIVGREIFDADGVYLWEFSPGCEYLEVGGGTTLNFHVPAVPGAYRLVAIARDPDGRIGLATSPFFVDGEIPDGRQPMPFAIDDAFASSGYMGAFWALSSEDIDSPNGACAGVGHRFVFNPPPINLWAGVAWQYPQNNWGSEPGLPIMAGGESVDFVAWSDIPGTVIDVFVGTPNSDGFQVGLDNLELTTEPTHYSVPIAGIEYDDIVIPFGWTISQTAGSSQRREVMISDLRWIGPPPPPPCLADFNDDRVVDGKDLGLLFSLWYSTVPGEVDLNGDGFVDRQDLNLLISAWGPCPE